MRTDDFDYQLPQELIAQEPAERRDLSRLLVLDRRTGGIEHRRFSDITQYIRPDDCLVVNDTRVIPARLMGHKAGTGGALELLLLEERTDGEWDVLLRAGRRPRAGDTMLFGDGRLTAVMVEDGELGRARVRFECAKPFMQIVEEIGEPPLPPYITRKSAPVETRRTDRERYQTVFAREPGAVAAPTAGLHFTPGILEQLDRMGVQRAAVTLHVGLGTFRPVSSDRVEEHVMEAERYEIGVDAADRIEAARREGRRIVAVGSTSVRTLESVYRDHGRIVPSHGRTALFIHPPYSFNVVGALLTNFHLPRSTLVMMVCAFAGRESVLRAYHEAIRERYRFYSYGDCMFIH